MKYKYDFSKEKDTVLTETRAIGFLDIIEAIDKGCLIDNIDHFNKDKYPKQRIYIVRISKKVYAVPYVIDKKRKIIFLKTIYPNSKLKARYFK